MTTKFCLLVLKSKKQIFKATILLITLLALSDCSDSKQGPQVPATTEELAKVLDLEAFVLMPGSEQPHQEGIASLSYIAAANMNSVYTFHQKFLLDNKAIAEMNRRLDKQAAAYKEKNKIP